MEKKTVDIVLGALSLISIVGIIMFAVTWNIQHLIVSILFSCEFWLILIYEKIKEKEK
jgi:hypothetical protein